MGRIDVLVPHGYKPPKKDIEAAWILAKHHKTVVSILRPVNRYRVKTPDLEMLDKQYELKTPETAQIRKVLTTISEAAEQADYIVVDMRRTKIIEKRMVELAKEALAHKSNKNVKQIAIIVNRKKVLEIER